MAKKEPGRFRKNLFGGFNRKDVLTYIKSIYDELDQTQTENEALHQRCAELEDLLQNMGKPPAWEPQFHPGPVVRAVAPQAPVYAQPTYHEPAPEIEEIEMEGDPEFFSILAEAPEAEPAPTFLSAPAPAPTPVPTPTPAPTPTPEPPVPAVEAPRQKPSLATPPAMQPAKLPAKVKVRRM